VDSDLLENVFERLVEQMDASKISSHVRLAKGGEGVLFCSH